MVSAREAGFEGSAKNSVWDFWAAWPDFAQGLHRLGTIGGSHLAVKPARLPSEFVLRRSKVSPLGDKLLHKVTVSPELGFQLAFSVFDCDSSRPELPAGTIG
jgi:hypothetical protein